MLRPEGKLRVLVSVVERDRVDGLARLDERQAREVASRVADAGAGLVLETCREATPDDIAASHSTWAKRLGGDGRASMGMNTAATTRCIRPGPSCSPR